MNAAIIFFTILIFMVTGAVISAIGILVCRIRVYFIRKPKEFKQVASFTPKLDLSITEVQEPVDKCTTDFHIFG